MAKQVLVIEDDREMGEILVEILGELDAEITLIANGREALNALEHLTPSLIFLDMHLPEISGIEILTYIRSQTRLSATKVVFMTADAIRGEAHKDKADVMIIKPMSFNQIMQIGERFLT